MKTLKFIKSLSRFFFSQILEEDQYMYYIMHESQSYAVSRFEEIGERDIVVIVLLNKLQQCALGQTMHLSIGGVS